MSRQDGMALIEVVVIILAVVVVALVVKVYG